MATKAMNFKVEESEALGMKRAASFYNITLTQVFRDAIKDYLDKMERDPFYRLTANVKDASEEETKEILDEIEGLSDDDLTIASVKHFSL